MVAPKITNSNRKETTNHVQLIVQLDTDVSGEESPKLKPTEIKRKTTDVFWLCFFGLLFVGWISAIIYVVSARDMYTHTTTGNIEIMQVTLEQTIHPLARANWNDTEIKDWSSLIESGVGTVVHEVSAHSTEILIGIFLELLKVIAVATVIYLVFYKYISAVCFCYQLLVRAMLLRLLVTIFVHIAALYWPHMVSRVHSVAWMVHIARKEYIADAFNITIIVYLNSMLYYLKNMDYDGSRMKSYLRCSFSFKLVINSTILLIVALTISAIQYTRPRDPLRYAILLGAYYCIEFLLTFANVTVAQAYATCYRTPKAEDVEDTRKPSLFQHAQIVARYHLGTVAFSTLNIFSLAQSIYIVLRYGFQAVKQRRSMIYSFWQKFYLYFNVASYSEVLTAVNGTDHYESKKLATILLSKYCVRSSVSMFKGIDSLLKCGCAVAVYVMILEPVFKLGFEYLPIMKKTRTDDLSVWILIGIAVGIAYTIYFDLFSFKFTKGKTSRMCWLQDRVHGAKKDVAFTKHEFVNCFDMLFAEERASWYYQTPATVASGKKDELREVKICDESKIEKITDDKSETGPSIVQGSV